ncbi:Serine/threonine-protein kinase UCN [Abeliophyllum distichum]|uniref:non-specific serine/threonine protein kinase n=1 Tax=Abeliophyllum distichum TaxID=126358 RepID=A0ABD1VVU3_9LAMI
MALEIIIGASHEYAMDWWALGVLRYEMLYRRTPFEWKNRKETFHKILATQLESIGKPDSLTDLIEKLLEKDPTCRLEYWEGAFEIKEHEFFRGLKWDLLTEALRSLILHEFMDLFILDYWAQIIFLAGA